MHLNVLFKRNKILFDIDIKTRKDGNIFKVQLVLKINSKSNSKNLYI
jgi:hypothetical protein